MSKVYLAKEELKLLFSNIHIQVSIHRDFGALASVLTLPLAALVKEYGNE